MQASKTPGHPAGRSLFYNGNSFLSRARQLAAALKASSLRARSDGRAAAPGKVAALILVDKCKLALAFSPNFDRQRPQHLGLGARGSGSGEVRGVLVLVLVLGRERQEREAGGRALARFDRGLNGKAKPSTRPCSVRCFRARKGRK